MEEEGMDKGALELQDILEYSSPDPRHLRKVEELLKHGVSPDAILNEFIYTKITTKITLFSLAVKRLVRAIYQKNLQEIDFFDRVLNLMLLHGATGNGGDTPALYHPVKFGYTFLVRRICRAGADPSATVETENGPYPLIFLSRNLRTAKLLYECGANPTYRPPDGRNPLIALLDLRIRKLELWDRPIDLTSPRLMQWFVEMGNDPIDHELLHHAVYYGNRKVLDLLVEYGNDPAEPDFWTGDTLLHIAAKSRTVNASDSFLQVVDSLVETHKLDVNSRDRSGKTPLDIALEMGHFRTALKLLESGARITRIPKGRHYVSRKVEEILVERGMYDSVIEKSLQISENHARRALTYLREEIDEIKRYSSEWDIPLTWKRALVVFPTPVSEQKNPYMKLGGVPPAIDLKSWPTAPRKHFARSYRELYGSLKGFKEWWEMQRERYRDFPEGTLPMEHFMTIDLRTLPERPEGLSPDIAALSIFAPRREVPTIQKPLLKIWTEEDLRRMPMNPEEVPAYVKFPTVYLDYVEVEIPMEARLVIAREYRPYVNAYSLIEEALILTAETKDELLPMMEAMKRMPVEVLNDFLCEMQFLMESLNMFPMIIGGISWVSPLVVNVHESFLPKARKLARKLIPASRARRLLLELEPQYILPEPFHGYSPPLILFTDDL